MKKIKQSILYITLLSLLLSSVAYAAPEESLETSEETIIEETIIEESTVEETVSENNNTEENTEDLAGDEVSVITSTEKNEENCCQISSSAIMPDGFLLDYYIEIQNKTTSKIYRLIGYHDNSYIAHMFIPEGDYYINQVSIWEDNTNDYPMVYPDDFSISKGQSINLETTLVEYDKINNESKKRLGIGEDSLVTEKDTFSDITPWNMVTHVGEGSGIVKKEGNALVPLNIIVKIVKSGNLKEAEMQVSTDEGKTFSKNILVKSSYTVMYINDKGHEKESGVKLTFDAGQYIEGDTYSYSSPKDYRVEEEAFGSGYLHVYNIDPIPIDVDLAIKILESGNQGSAVFTFSFTGKNGVYSKKEITVPSDGKCEITGTTKNGEIITILLDFYIPGEVKVGDLYTCSIPKEKIKHNSLPQVFLFFVVLFVVIALGYLILLSLKEKPSLYTLNTYNSVHLETKKRKQRKEKNKNKNDNITKKQL